MTPAPPVTLPEALEAVRTLLGDHPADEVVFEVTRHGTMRLTAKRGGEVVAQAKVMATGLGRRR